MYFQSAFKSYCEYTVVYCLKIEFFTQELKLKICLLETKPDTPVFEIMFVNDSMQIHGRYHIQIDRHILRLSVEQTRCIFDDS